jgi:Replication factor C C-terminal domain
MKNSGISLAAIIKNLAEKISASESNEIFKGNLLIKMAEIENNLSLGCLDIRQLGGLVGAFFEVRFITA